MLPVACALCATVTCMTASAGHCVRSCLSIVQAPLPPQARPRAQVHSLGSGCARAARAHQRDELRECSAAAQVQWLAPRVGQGLGVMGRTKLPRWRMRLCCCLVCASFASGMRWLESARWLCPCLRHKVLERLRLRLAKALCAQIG
jgi:hypothetical protein